MSLTDVNGLLLEVENRLLWQMLNESRMTDLQLQRLADEYAVKSGEIRIDDERGDEVSHMALIAPDEKRATEIADELKRKWQDVEVVRQDLRWWVVFTDTQA